MAQIGYTKLYINNKIIGASGLVWEPSDSQRSARFDTIDVPGQEFEKDRYKGRSLIMVSLKFRAYDDDTQLAELQSIVEMLVTDLSDTGARVAPLKVHTIAYAPLVARKCTRMIVANDSGPILYSAQSRCHEWACKLRQYSKFVGSSAYSVGISESDLGGSSGMGGAPSPSPKVPNAQSVISGPRMGQ